MILRVRSTAARGMASGAETSAVVGAFAVEGAAGGHGSHPGPGTFRPYLSSVHKPHLRRGMDDGIGAVRDQASGPCGDRVHAWPSKSSRIGRHNGISGRTSGGSRPDARTPSSGPLTPRPGRVRRSSSASNRLSALSVRGVVRPAPSSGTCRAEQRGATTSTARLDIIGRKASRCV